MSIRGSCQEKPWPCRIWHCIPAAGGSCVLMWNTVRVAEGGEKASSETATGPLPVQTSGKNTRLNHEKVQTNIRPLLT